MSAAGFNEGLNDNLSPQVDAPSFAGGRTTAPAAGMTIGDITIHVTSDDPEKAGESVLAAFEARFAGLMGGMVAEVGA